MGKKGSWFSAIKRVFTHNSKDKRVNESESKNPKEPRKKVRELRHGETKSFIPVFRGPSSIEKILGEVDEERLLNRPPTPFEPPKTSPFLTPRVASPKAAAPKATSPRVTSPRASSPKAASIRVTSPRASSQRVASPKAASSRDVNRHKEVNCYRPEPTLRYRHLSATKIQAAYRGHMARRSFRAIRGLVRLQGVVQGQNVRRQTANAMKMMQLLVRVQTQIQSQRILKLENQALQRQAHKFDKELESTLEKWAISQSVAGNQEDWDDSTLTKEEREARMQKKMEAALRRERAMAYAYSHQSLKSNPKLAQTSAPEVGLGGFPWWWNRLERQLPATTNPPENQAIRTFNLTPPRRTPEPKPSPRQPSTHKQPHYMTFENYEATTPTSARSTRSKHFIPAPTHKTPPGNSSGIIKFPKTKPSGASSVYEMGLKDDDSLMSCPPYSVPNYMTPTASAQAKARPRSNPKERFPVTPGNDSKRRFSFPVTPSIGPFKWNKGSSKKDSGLKKVLERQQSFESGGDFSIDSAISMPAAVGRKPFNRFV